MTVETEVATLTTAVDNLTTAVNVSKATLDASVASSLGYANTSNTHKTGSETAKTGAEAARDLTYTYSQNAASAVAYQDLTAIAQAKAVTAVDVFVYDTSKDSDGGAWRKRTQATSWYNETLNTATRGSRKEFPAVAVIVAESNKVTIYDGDDPAMPMWMVFTNAGVLSWATSSSAPIATAKMLNGMLVAGGAQAGCLMSFLEDDVQLMNSSAYSLTSSRLISGRNGTTAWVGSGGYVILHYIINDIAMTILPNAPIDSATGLPIPTIAIATSGGVSVIKDDGSVVDITFSSFGVISSIDFRDDGSLVYLSDNSYSRRFLHVDYAIPTVDFAKGAGYVGTADDEYYHATASIYAGHSLYLLAGVYGVSGKNTYGNTSGFNIINPNTTTPSEGSVAYITSDYNTGYMVGDIKLAALSDTDATNVVGTNLITTAQSQFTSASGWSAGGAGLVFRA